MISYIGRNTVKTVHNFKNLTIFTAESVMLLFNLKNFDKATRKVLINQIYFTSVQILPFFLIVAILFGSSVVGVLVGGLKNLDLITTLGDIAFDFIVTELAPLTTVALIVLRSSSAINTEIAVMCVNRELETLRAFNINPKRYLVMTRMINMVISLAALTTVYIFVSASLGSIYSALFFGMSMDIYFHKIIHFITLKTGMIIYFKTTLFGIAISTIPIYSGINTKKTLTAIPISVLTGMVGIFKAIIFIEVILFLPKLI